MQEVERDLLGLTYGSEARENMTQPYAISFLVGNDWLITAGC